MPSPQKIELPQKDTTVSLSVTITSIDNVPDEALINLTATVTLVASVYGSGASCNIGR